MMLKRRTLIEGSGRLLVALGLSGGSLAGLCDRYGQALAQPAPRKRALLIGINQYAGADSHGSPLLPPLQGCLTDVELQRELLQYRFGFSPDDILTLTDTEATRQALIDTILAALIEPVQPEDLIVLHFSGYGGQVSVPTVTGEPQTPEQQTQQPQTRSQQFSFVPTDSLVNFAKTTAVQDLVESTLTHLIQAIPAQQVFVVLDTSHTLESISLDPALRSRSRNFSTVPETQPAKITWPQSLNPSHYPVPLNTTSGRLKDTKATILSATAWDSAAGQALEAGWAGFHAGVLTYALTQQLWATIPPRQSFIDFGRLQQRLQQLTHNTQRPQLSSAVPAPSSGQSLCLASADGVAQGVEGVVTDSDDSHAELTVWLGGVAPQLLDYLPNTIFQLLRPGDSATDPLLYVQVKSREGLWAKAKLLPANPPVVPLSDAGAVREVVRLLPQRLGLTLALDRNLGRIERVDATSALASIPAIAAIVNSDQQVDCRLGRVPDFATLQINGWATPAPMQSLASLTLQAEALPQNHYGLLSPSRVPIPTTLGQEDEAIAAATRRLIPHLQTLLAAKLLRLLVNTEVSQLGLLATLTLLKETQSIEQTQRSTRAIQTQATVATTPAVAPTGTPAGTAAAPAAGTTPSSTHPERVAGLSIGAIAISPGFSLRFQVENLNPENLYLLLFGIDQLTGQMTYFPLLLNSLELNVEPAILTLEAILRTQALQESQQIHYPISPPTSAWKTAYKSGDYALYLVASPSPFTQTWRELSYQVNVRTLSQETPAHLSNGLAISQALLADLHQASLQLSSPLLSALKDSSEPKNSDVAALHVAAWAGFEFRFQVTA